MIRVVIFLLALALAALGLAWLADRPGEVVITWLGYRVETSVMVLICAVAVLALLVLLVWSLLRSLWRAPRNVVALHRNRRRTRGQHAIARGLIAIGAGDLRAARRFAGEARRFAHREPLALLLDAQTAQLAGNRTAADDAFRAMAARDDTRLLGLHGLFVEAQRRDDRAAARALAEEAVRADPSLAWAGQAVLEFRCAAGDWAGALAALDSGMKSGLLDKASYRRKRAVLLTARALSADRDSAKADALEAVKLAPDLVPAAALAGRLLSESGEARKAARVIEAAWRINPHPALAAAYENLRPGDSARERLARMQALAKLSGNNPEGALAVARTAIDAREFAVARETLAPLLAAPTQRVATLMAELEEADTGDIGRAREWMARALHAARDPAWTADGLVSDVWLPVSPASGRLDAFEWKVPLAELAPPAGRVIDQRGLAPAPGASSSPPPARPAEMPPAIEAPEIVPASPLANGASAEARPADADDAKAVRESSGAPAQASAPAAEAAPGPSQHQGVKAPREAHDAPAAGRRARPVEAVIPLVHAPDDPGPESPPDVEPAPEPPRRQSWLRALFG
jgi:HemY protein